MQTRELSEAFTRYSTVACFKNYTGLNLSQRSGRCNIKLLKMDSYIAIQNHFLWKRNINAKCYGLVLMRFRF